MSTSYFGRRFKVVVTPQATGEDWTVADSSWGNEALRIRFEIEQQTNQAWPSAAVEIYNLDPDRAQVITQNDAVSVIAGYESPASDTPIFTGQIYQALWERSGEFDTKLTLHCLFGMLQDMNSKVSVSLTTSGAAPLTQAEAVRQVAAAAGIEVAALAPVLSTQTYARGRVITGNARKFFDDIAISNHLSGCWIGPDGLHIVNLAPQTTTPDVVYAPPYSPVAAGASVKYILVGTPAQTQLGVNFRTLLDNSARLGGTVQLSGVTTKRLAAVPLKFQRPFAQDAVYVVAGMRHIGDSRGNEWNTEIEAVFTNWDQIRLQFFTH
jgi:hypothetical protein